MFTEKERDMVARRLLAQYQEYSLYQTRLDALKQQRLLAAPAGTAAIGQKIALYKTLRQQTADEMTFASPLIWMLYKARAYAGTAQSIDTLDDFRQHCSPSGYICTKRYSFVKKSLSDRGFALERIPGDTLLAEIVRLPEVATLESDAGFMRQWQEYEYFRQKGRIAKWESYT